jgi:hypothetical protein
VSELRESAFGTAISQNKSVILNENAKKKHIVRKCIFKKLQFKTYVEKSAFSFGWSLIRV